MTTKPPSFVFEFTVMALFVYGAAIVVFIAFMIYRMW